MALEWIRSLEILGGKKGSRSFQRVGLQKYLRRKIEQEPRRKRNRATRKREISGAEYDEGKRKKSRSRTDNENHDEKADTVPMYT